VFASDAVPEVVDTADNSALELGVRFAPDADGFVTGVRFYKGPANLGTHVGRLWTDGGGLLASVTFTNESTSGWQTATFSTPVAVTAGTVYRVSYSAPVGRYSSSSGFFGSAYQNSPLTALADANGGNGVYSTSPGSFPVNTFGATNYWVDAVFAATPPTDETPPTVTGTSPAAATTAVAPSSRVTATFTETVRASSVGFTVTGPSGAVAGSVSYDASTSTAAFSPNTSLAPGTLYTATVSGAQDTAGNALAAPVSWTFTTATLPAQTCPCSIWPETVTPAVPSANDTAEVELGVKVRVAEAGFITGIRFYKGAANIGTHTGTLWSSGGSVLATGTFIDETAGGWQSLTFAAPVAVSPGMTYVASYHAPVGGYAADLGYLLESGVDTSTVSALRAGVDGVNGVFRYGASAFPTSGSTSNYWVDVAYTPSAGDTTPPTVTTWTPATGATDVAATTTVAAVFIEEVAPASVVMTLHEKVSGTAVTGTTSYDAANRRVTFTPSAALGSGRTYTASANATDTAGNGMTAPATSEFTTADTTGPVISAVSASGSGTTAIVTWTTDESSTSVVAYGTSPGSLTSTATGASGVTAHPTNLTGLTENTRYYYRVTSVDQSGNSTTSPATTTAPAQYTPAVTPVGATTFADFSTGTNSGTYVAKGTDGEVTLNPTRGNEFEGTALGSGWSTTAVATGGVTTVTGGTATPDGAYLRTTTTSGPSQIMEFSSTLGTAANRVVGFGTTFSGTSMAAFSTGTGNQLLAVTRTGGGTTVSTTLTASLATTPHVYRIERSVTSIVFKIDGVTVATRSILLLDSWAVGGRDSTVGGGGPAIQWMRVMPYTSSGTYTSAVVDGRASVTWGAISRVATLNGGTVTVQTRTGSSATPGTEWTGWTTRADGATVGVTSRYVQYRLALTRSSTTSSTPVVDSVSIAFSVP